MDDPRRVSTGLHSVNPLIAASAKSSRSSLALVSREKRRKIVREEDAEINGRTRESVVN